MLLTRFRFLFLGKEIRAIERENERLRAALAQSELPCAYCSRSREEWSRCDHGFPGCPRADDANGCPMLWEAMSLHGELEALRDLRPLWAQGYTSDSVAAQASAAAFHRPGASWWEEMHPGYRGSRCSGSGAYEEKRGWPDDHRHATNAPESQG